MAATAYSTYTEIRDQLRVTGTLEFADATITEMIAEATAKIDRDTGRTWQQSNTVTDEYYTGDGSKRLILKHPDVTSLDALSINISPTGTTYTTVTTTKARLWTDIGVLELQPDAEVSYFPEYINSIKATYKYGLTTIPSDIKLACRYLVAYKLKLDENINSEYNEIVKSYRIDKFYPV